MIDRRTALENIVAGDIFHAEHPNGASLICLAVSVTDSMIVAKTVTTQQYYEFDRRTGIARAGAVECVIDSVAPLPREIHDVMLGIDRKFGVEAELEHYKLTEDEKRALVFVASFYPSHPI
jgi:hypothetical protein